MKSLFSLSIAIITGLFVLAWSFMLAETFTEGIRVSPETISLKAGQYVWEPERAPEGPLLIVASVTEQVAYVYRNGICIARSSVRTWASGSPYSHRRFHDSGKRGSSYLEYLQGGRDALHGARDLGRDRVTCRETCRDTLIPMDVSGCRLNFPSCCSESR